MAKKFAIPIYVWIIVAAVGLIAVVNMIPGVQGGLCPGSQVYCPGVGCVSGQDKCFPGAKGGPTAVFSKETFFSKWPGRLCLDPARLRRQGELCRQEVP